MHTIQSFFCIGEGTPDLDGLSWRRPVLNMVDRKDPFTGRTIPCPTWIAAEGEPPGQCSDIHWRTNLRTDPAWVRAGEVLSARSAALHDGMLFELWLVVIGKDAAQRAWRPSWLAEDGSAQLISFPVAATAWLAEQQEPSSETVVSAWIELPYLTNTAGPHSREAAEALLHVLTPGARHAVLTQTQLMALASGYTLP